jgi:SEC-C motif
MRPGRNDPCWCGSGKKYKKCHLASDEAGAPTGSESQVTAAPLHQRLLEEVIEGTQRWHTRSEALEATRLYFGKRPGEIDAEPEAADGFAQWYVRDFRHPVTGRTPVEEYLCEANSRLSPREREMLESWRDARFGLYEAEVVEEGRGVALRDLCSGDRYFVHDVKASRSLVRWDCLVSRVEYFEGKWLFGGNGTVVPRPLVPELLLRIVAEAKKTGQGSVEFLRSNSHKLHRMITDLHQERIAGLQIVNFEGDLLEVSVARYRIVDEPALLTALRGVPEFEENLYEDETSEIHSFAWLETGVRESRRSYGIIAIKAGRLRLECNSRARLKLGRQLVEQHAGPAVVHLRDSFESLQAANRRMGRAPKEKEAAVPFEVETELLRKMKEDHYAKWPDHPLPALGGKTPRSAVRTGSRQAVLELIRVMENNDARASKQGQPAYDFSRLRQNLGLEEE